MGVRLRWRNCSISDNVELRLSIYVYCASFPITSHPDTSFKQISYKLSIRSYYLFGNLVVNLHRFVPHPPISIPKCDEDKFLTVIIFYVSLFLTLNNIHFDKTNVQLLLLPFAREMSKWCAKVNVCIKIDYIRISEVCIVRSVESLLLYTSLLYTYILYLCIFPH